MDRRGGDRSQPLYTPAMAGGLFAIDKVIKIFVKTITISSFEKEVLFIQSMTILTRFLENNLMHSLLSLGIQ
jgi:hypothetical protein